MPALGSASGPAEFMIDSAVFHKAVINLWPVCDVEETNLIEK